MSVFDFPHTVDVFAYAHARDRYGGSSPTEEAVHEDEPAWVQPASANDVLEADRRDIKVSHVVYFKRDVELGSWHRIRYGDKVYRVTGYREATAGLAVFWKALAIEDVKEAES